MCAERLAHAQRVCDGAAAIILSGWARHPRLTAEAELMRAAWTGGDVVVCDPDARSTAENAANVAAAAAALGADELVVVTSHWHRPRARILVEAAGRARGLDVAVDAAPGRMRPLLAAREVAAAALLPVQLRRLRRDVGSRP